MNTNKRIAELEGALGEALAYIEAVLGSDVTESETYKYLLSVLEGHDEL